MNAKRLSLLTSLIFLLTILWLGLIVRARGLKDPNGTKKFNLYSRQEIYFYENGRKHSLRFDTFNPEPFVGRTEVYLDGETSPQVELSGFFNRAYPLDIEGDRRPEIEIEVESGHSLNSVVYKYADGFLVRIPVSTEISGSWQGIVSRNTPEFTDLDGDGVLEMRAYYRFFPPEKRRQVEVYKFDGQRFNKVKDYEEETTEVYL